MYYILGTSLAEGKGYRLLNEPGEIEAIQYPPLLPLVVALHQKLLGTSDFLVVGPWLRLFYFFLSLCFTIAVYLLIRLYLSPAFALPAALVSSFYFFVYYWSDTLYADIPFALATVIFVLCNHKPNRAACRIAAGVIAAVAFLLRTAGIALLAAWVAESLLLGRYRQIFFRAGVALVPVLIWQSHIIRVQNSHQYRTPGYAYQRAAYQYANVTYAENSSLIDPFKPELGRITTAEMLRRVGKNLAAMPIRLGEPVSSPLSFGHAQLKWLLSLCGSNKPPPWQLVTFPLALIGCLTIAGIVLLWTRLGWFIPIYIAIYVLLTCMAPWSDQFPRYLMPLTPFLALSLFHLLAVVAEWRGRQTSSWYGKASLGLTLLLLAMIFLAQGLTLVQTYARGRGLATYYDVSGKEIKFPLFYYDPQWEMVNTALEWLRRRAQPGEVIAATAPHSAYLRTGLKAVLPPLEVDSDQAQRLLDSVPVRYVILDVLGSPGISERYTTPTIEKNSRLWKLIYTAPGGGARIYERVQ